MTILDIPVKTLAGQDSSLGAVASPGPGLPGPGLTNKALLVVNVASKCGLTPQYTALEKLHEQFASRGFAVVGFPCNQFGGQEPGTADEIAEFCSATYGVTFPMFEKIEVIRRGRGVGGDVDGVLPQHVQRDDLQRAFVGGGQHHRSGGAVAVARSQFAAVTHHLSPGTRPGKLN